MTTGDTSVRCKGPCGKLRPLYRFKTGRRLCDKCLPGKHREENLRAKLREYL